MFYVKDWLSEPRIQALMAERKWEVLGVYITILFLMWIHSDDQCWLPAKTARSIIGGTLYNTLVRGDDPLLDLCKAVDNPTRFSTMDYVFSKRLQQDATELRQRREQCSESGRKGAQVRWGKDGKP